jgi:arabinofuranosyltransferase
MTIAPAPSSAATQGRSLRDTLGVAALLLLAVAGLLALYLVAEARTGGRGFPLDDAWIHLQIARNLALHGTYGFDPARPLSASTAPLWTAMLAAVHRATSDLPTLIAAVQALGGLLLFGTCLLAYALARGLGCGRATSLLAGLFLAGCPYLTWGAVSGLEVPLYTGLTLATILLLQRGRFLPAAVVAGIAVYARPECFLLLPFGAAVVAFVFRRSRISPSIPILLLVYLGTLLPYFVLNLSLNGSLFPTTFRAKTQSFGLLSALASGDSGQIVHLLFVSSCAYLGQFLEHLYVMNPLWVVGLALFLAYSWVARRTPAGKLRLAAGIFVLAYPFLMGIFAPFTTAHFQMGRYIANVTALAVVFAVIGFADLVGWVARRRRSSVWPRALASVVLALGLWNTGVGQRFMVAEVARDTRTIRSIQIHFARYLRENTPEGSTIAVNDVGAIGYFSQRPLIDLGGIVTPEINDYVAGQSIRDIGLIRYLQTHPFDYIAAFPVWIPYLSRSPNLEAVYSRDYPDNTIAAFAFFPRASRIAGLVLTRVWVKPAPVRMVVYRPLRTGGTWRFARPDQVPR